MTNAADGDVVLALSGITKRYAATVALEDVTIRVRRGTVHALLGENGAGKTTLMRIAFGLTAPDAGRVSTADRVIATPADAIDAGIGMVHQHFTNVPAMTVAENVSLGGRGRFDQKRAAERVADIARRTGLALDPKARVERLSVGAQQRLEIVKALAQDARILILDEPTAVLAPEETEELLRWLRAFASAGNAVVLITHKLREALAIADDVTVLRRGRVAMSGSASGATAESLSAALLGEELSTMERNAPAAVGDIVASLSNVDAVDDRGVAVLRKVTLSVRGGEIAGIAAVEGAGQRELLRVLADRLKPSTGTVDLPPSSAFVPEDRQRDALILDFSPTENVVLKGAGARRGRIPWLAERRRTRVLVSDYDVRGGDAARNVRALSGGNQQKLVLARELEGNPPLVVAENPTRGLDIRASRAVHDRLRVAAANGAAVVVYSSDLDEVLSIATRMFVIHAGHLREMPLDRDLVGRAMLGGA